LPQPIRVNPIAVATRIERGCMEVFREEGHDKRQPGNRVPRPPGKDSLMRDQAMDRLLWLNRANGRAQFALNAGSAFDFSLRQC
jgi:hypothetical protein